MGSTINNDVFSASLIADNGYHKLSFAKNGKNIKLAIGKILSGELTTETAMEIVKEVALIVNGKYTKDFLEKALVYRNEYGFKGRFDTKSLELALRIIDFDEDKVDGLKKCFTILNMGPSTAGKSSFTLNGAVRKEYRSCFSPLISLRETTSFEMGITLNDNNSETEVQIYAFLKNSDEIINGVENIILDLYIETINAVGNMLVENPEANDAFEKATLDLVDRLKKTQDNTINLNRAIGNEIEISRIEFEKKLRAMFLSVERKLLNSASYEKEEYDETIIRGIEKVAFEEKSTDKTDNLDKRTMIVMETEEAKEILKKLSELLEDRMNKFKNDYNDVFQQFRKRDINGIVRECYIITQEIGETIEERKNTKWLLSVIFDNKNMTNKDGFYTIAPFIASAEIKLPHYDVLSELPTIRIVDTVGLNQKKEDVKNQISGNLQKYRPDIILYHTRLDQKDETLNNNVEFINALGYGKRTRIVYGRIDTCLEKYVETFYDIERDELRGMNPEDIDLLGFEAHIQTEYLMSERQNLSKIVGNENIYLCDKNQTYPLIKRYSPEHFMLKMLPTKVEEEKFRFPEGFKDNFIKCLYRTNLVHDIYSKFTEKKIEKMLPLEYRLLIWSPLQKAIEEMYYDREGWGKIQPAIEFKGCVMESMETKQVKFFLDENYRDHDDFIREFLETISDIVKFRLISQYKVEFNELLRLRHDYNYRKMRWCSMTDERKHRLRNDFTTRITDDELVGKTAIIESLIETTLKIMEDEKKKSVQ